MLTVEVPQFENYFKEDDWFKISEAKVNSVLTVRDHLKNIIINAPSVLFLEFDAMDRLGFFKVKEVLELKLTDSEISLLEKEFQRNKITGISRALIALRMITLNKDNKKKYESYLLESILSAKRHLGGYLIDPPGGGTEFVPRKTLNSLVEIFSSEFSSEKFLSKSSMAKIEKLDFRHSDSSNNSIDNKEALLKAFAFSVSQQGVYNYLEKLLLKDNMPLLKKLIIIKELTPKLNNEEKQELAKKLLKGSRAEQQDKVIGLEELDQNRETLYKKLQVWVDKDLALLRTYELLNPQSMEFHRVIVQLFLLNDNRLGLNKYELLAMMEKHSIRDPHVKSYFVKNLPIVNVHKTSELLTSFLRLFPESGKTVIQVIESHRPYPEKLVPILQAVVFESVKNEKILESIKSNLKHFPGRVVNAPIQGLPLFEWLEARVQDQKASSANTCNKTFRSKND
jgi:hypothetical protein